ncbi:alpha/beta fold hydrolase [Tessaracoccus oleiagri]|uniref:Pimeloyl-ACP methyl ester carboxylesterase n=1 Tax=Tessaracoccus oleiagri TaxID=686624 RepID=A0A1G9JVP9_9ACTN|nr:alpha/beta hydrolase [Tessaracoccus oleiagri]SDL41234.1 Pimeloyl-ACP methyl ester carboxylesterase [Tessaracoccus oleiagri]
MDIILIAGLWLDASAWDDVIPGLRAAGHRPVAVMLPGQGVGTTATLDDQLDAVLREVDAAEGPAMVVGHSAAATLAWLAGDRRPEKVAKVVMVGGMPSRDGDAYAPFFEPVEGMVPFPGWKPFAGPDSDDLDEAARAEMERRVVAVPGSVTHAPVRYTSDARKRIPVVLVCPEFSVDDAQAWFEAGEMPELIGVQRLDYVDIDSGHWPMFSKPAGLARILAELAQS